MNYQIKALEAEKDKILRDLYENGKFLNKIDKILNASKSQNKENLDQIGLLSQKLDEVNEERLNFTNLIKTDMKKIIDNIIHHLSSDNHNVSRIKAQELSTFYRSLLNYIEEKTANDHLKQ